MTADNQAARTWERRLVAELCDMDAHDVDEQQISDLRGYLAERDVRDIAVLSEHLGLPPDEERDGGDIADAIIAMRTQRDVLSSLLRGMARRASEKRRLLLQSRDAAYQELTWRQEAEDRFSAELSRWAEKNVELAAENTDVRAQVAAARALADRMDERVRELNIEGDAAMSEMADELRAALDVPSRQLSLPPKDRQTPDVAGSETPAETVGGTLTGHMIAPGVPCFGCQICLVSDCDLCAVGETCAEHDPTEDELTGVPEAVSCGCGRWLPCRHCGEAAEPAPASTSGFCCDWMREHSTLSCGHHDEPRDCPDVLVVHGDQDVAGLPVRDGGGSFVLIGFCPWCGTDLLDAAGSVTTPPDPAAILRAAAQGRREYAVNAPREQADALNLQAATLDQAADIAGGDYGALYSWLPSWRWTKGMEDRLFNGAKLTWPDVAALAGSDTPAPDEAAQRRERDLDMAWRSCRDDINAALDQLAARGCPPVEADGISITLRRYLARVDAAADVGGITCERGRYTAHDDVIGDPNSPRWKCSHCVRADVDEMAARRPGTPAPTLSDDEVRAVARMVRDTTDPALIGTHVDPEFVAHQEHKHAVDGCGYCPEEES